MARLPHADELLGGEGHPRGRTLDFLAAIVESSDDAIIGKTLDGTIMSWNAAAHRIYGYAPEEVLGQNISVIFPPDRMLELATLLDQIAAGERIDHFETARQHKDGSLVEVSVTMSPVLDAAGEVAGASSIAREIGERKRFERLIEYGSLHDTLTDLPNRVLLHDRIEHELARCQRNATSVGILFIDLDHLKLVNDTLGHAAGDRVLRLMAQRLQAAMRVDDTVGRFGGDEFVVVCGDLHGHDEADVITQRIAAALSAPFDLNSTEVVVTASIGVVIGEAGDTPEALLSDADAAIHVAKAHGRARVEHFDVSMRHQAETRLATDSALRRALERDEFTIHYQPVIDLTDNAVIGAEALLRWHHPDQGLVGPTEFISVAEDTGLIIPIGAWVLAHACSQLGAWRRERSDPFSIWVNLSIRQLHDPRLRDTVTEAISDAGIPPELLGLEITETALTEDLETVSAALARLKQLEVQLAVDDFGTGYGSLTYLRSFPIDTVKIDQTFVANLGHDRHNSAIISAVVTMARALGLTVVSEGVESQEQAIGLRALGCDHAQGYYFSRPLPAEEFHTLMSRGTSPG